MSNLLYKTRANSSPQGKQRVYFACHPQDFALYFEEICDDIFASQNCAIYYREDYSAPWQGDDLQTTLSAMQLIVIPVTARFLMEQNLSRCEEFAFAVKNGIPVLPLMQEENLAYSFNAICGEFQFLDKRAQDITALPYKDKLEVFLKNVLCGDELSQRVRDAFDAYIFLSYRKKDRRYAQRLMRLIHEAPACRDIAIWYDEFLVPGENFNSGIEEALHKSQLVVMNVTPNMVNEPNYIISIEYPAAVQAQKPIVAVQMVETEQSLLNQNYANIPSSVDGYDKEKLKKALHQGLGKLNDFTNDNDPNHLFLIGVAYLNGIDVEVDIERGLQMVKASAQGGNVEAMKFLSDMYIAGKAVAYDPKQSAFWQQKVVDVLQEEYQAKQTLESGIALLDGFNTLGARYLSTGDNAQSQSCMQMALPICESITQKFDDVACYDALASVYHALATLGNIQRLPDAPIYADKALELYAMLENNDHSPRHKAQLAEALTAKSASLESVNLPLATEMAQQSLQLRRDLVEQDNSADNRMWLALALNGLGKLVASQGESKVAKGYFMEALDISHILCEEQRKASSVAVFILSANNLGMCYQQLGDFANAKRAMELSLQRGLWLTESCKLAVYFDLVATSQTNLSALHLNAGMLEEAEEWLQKGLAVKLDILRDYPDVKHLYDCASAYLMYADLCKRKGDTVGQMAKLQEASSLLQKGVDASPLPCGPVLVGVCMQLFDLFLSNNVGASECLKYIDQAKDTQKLICKFTGKPQDFLGYILVCIDHSMINAYDPSVSLATLEEITQLILQLQSVAPQGEFEDCVSQVAGLAQYLVENFQGERTLEQDIFLANLLLDLYQASKQRYFLQYGCQLTMQAVKQDQSNADAMKLFARTQKLLQ